MNFLVRKFAKFKRYKNLSIKILRKSSVSLTAELEVSHFIFISSLERLVSEIKIWIFCHELLDMGRHTQGFCRHSGGVWKYMQYCGVIRGDRSMLSEGSGYQCEVKCSVPDYYGNEPKVEKGQSFTFCCFESILRKLQNYGHFFHSLNNPQTSS